MNMRPVLYVLSDDVTLLSACGQVASSLDMILLPVESWSNLAAHFEEDSPSVVVVSQRGSFDSTLFGLGDFCSNHPEVQVLLGLTSWKGSDISSVIRLGVADVVEMPAEASSIMSHVEALLERSRSRTRQVRYALPTGVMDQLSFQEARILELVLNGRTVKQIGSELDLSIRTIHYRKKSILAKLGVANRTEAIEMLRRSMGLQTFDEVIR